MLVFNPVVQNLGLVDPIWTGIYGYLFSPGRSIFLYSPPLLITVFSWATFQKRFKNEAWLFIMIFLVYLGTYSFFSDWAGGWCWGPRHLLAIITLFILPLGILLDQSKKRLAAMTLTITGAFIQFLGIVIGYSYIHADWEKMGYTYPSQEFIFIPRVSPIAMHIQALLEGRYIDPWLFRVYQNFGLLVAIGSLIVPLVIFMAGFTLIRRHNA